MSWKKEIKKEIKKYGSDRDYIDRRVADQTKRMNAERRKKRTARKHLETDVKNVTREQEDIRWDEVLNYGLDSTSTREMEELSKALGKVSALLQKWL